MFAAPLGLLALLAVPAIVALHLFRRRFVPRPVSALFLWSDADRTPLAGRKRERLRRSWSLWAECLAAVCLALALAGLRGCGDQPGEHLVVVLDASASMDAQREGQSIAARAVREVESRLEALPRGSRVTLVQSGRHPTLLAGPAAFPEEARARLAGYAPRAQRHDLLGALAFALQVSGGGRVLVLTDRYEPERLPPEIELVALGAPLDNVGITHAARERVLERETKALREQAFVRVDNFSSATQQRRARVASVDAPEVDLAEPRTLELAPGAQTSLTWKLPPGTPPVVVTLAGDALAIDDQAFLAPPPARTLALASTLALDEQRALGLTTRAEQPLDRLLGIVADCVLAADLESAHLVIGAAPAAGSTSASWTLAFECPGSERKDWIGPFLFERRHPLLSGTTFEGLVWSADPAHTLQGIPLVAAGNVPLLVEDEVGGRRVFTLNLDPRRSTLARSPDWPILLSNLCELRRRTLPGPSRTNLAVGDELDYRKSALVREEDGELVLAAEPGTPASLGTTGARRYPPRPTLRLDEFEAPGTYTLKQGDTLLARVAVSFADAHESDLRGGSSGRRPAQGDAARIEAQTSWVEALLLGLAALLVLFDWLVLRRAVDLAAGSAKKEPHGLPAS